MSVLPAKFRYLLTKLRVCNTKLPIEQGRYKNIPRHLRHCNLCNSNTIGDEFHFLLECPILNDLRKLHLPR